MKSLCDDCELNTICALRVLSKDVGLPKYGYGTQLSESVKDCKYYDNYEDLKSFKTRIYTKIEKIFVVDLNFIDGDSYLSIIKEIIYGKRAREK